METLLLNFSFLIGDSIPVGNKVWDLYLLCREIYSIVSSLVTNEFRLFRNLN